MDKKDILRRGLWQKRLRRSRLMLRPAVVTLVVIPLLGCSAARKPFRSTTRVNLAPFAEHTIAMASDVQYGLGQARTTYLRPFVDGPEVENYVAMWHKVRRVIRGIVAYSVEIVTLSESTLDGPERCNALATFVDEMLQPVIAKPRPPLHFTEDRLDEIFADIRRQETLIDGLNAAQPIIDEVARVSASLFDQVKDSQLRAVDEISAKIDAESVGLIEFHAMLKAEQIVTLNSYMLLRDHRRGDENALEALMQNEVSLKEFIKGSKVTQSDFMVIEERLFNKMSTVRALKEQIAPDLEQYRAQQRELGDLMRLGDKSLHKVKIIVVAWSRAHRKLASGITDPAKVNMFGITKKIVDAAL
jgi:hypothetical protein